jgi:DNA-binding NarL/FixJ family response regulator
MRLLVERSGMQALDVESLPRAGRLARGRGGVVLLWLGFFCGPGEIAEAAELRRDQGDLALCVIADGVDEKAFAALVDERLDRLALLDRSCAEVDDIVAALALVARGGTRLPSARAAGPANPEEELVGGLTEYEREVLELIAHGLRNCAIARRLWKSEKAIEKTVARIFQKLGLEARIAPDLDRRVTAARIYFSTCRLGVGDLLSPSTPAVPTMGPAAGPTGIGALRGRTPLLSGTAAR